MKILITGAGGFIGSNICNLLSNSYTVLALSRNFDKLEKNPNIICHHSNMADYYSLENIFFNFKPDVVIHCAWAGGNASKDLNEMWQVDNINQSIELLRLCSLFNVEHFIGFGSSAEYGNYDQKFNDDSYCFPNTMYGITKNSFKMISEKYCQMNDIKFTWIRPVFTYGPRDVQTRLIPKAILSFLTNKDLTLNKCSANVDYLYIDDFCRAINNIVEQKLQGTYLVCSDQETNVKSLVEIIYNKIKPSSQLIFDHNLQDNSHQYICGTSKKLMTLSNWKPLIDLESGLDKTISYFQKFV